jgi:ABC-type nitrate/sulfonate/bicarbonate transport system substrate-binding protein
MRFSNITLGFAFLHIAWGLKIATSLLWIEHTPQPYAIKNFYKGSSQVSRVSGGAAELARDSSFDLAANAETQGLKRYNQNRKLRLIYVICEVPYRLVANQAAGIRTLADLRGKRVGLLRGSSSEAFVNTLLSSAGLRDTDYNVVTGNVCMRPPCGPGTFPHMITNRQVDAFGLWEPTVELGARALGNNAIIFQNESIYREVYAFYTSTDKLNNPAKRKDIVEFVRALNLTLDVFTNKPETVYQTVASAVRSEASLVRDVWADHKWVGTWTPELLEFLVLQDAYLARKDRRQVTPRADLQKFLDTSIVDELGLSV